MKDTFDQRKKRSRKIVELLEKEYKEATIALNFSNTWELLVAVILSAQCTDKMVNIVTKDLFKKYPTLDDYVKADSMEFERNIKSTGFYRNKAKNILATAKIIQDQYAGQVPNSMEELIKLPGVARKTANIVLGNAFEVYEGIAVDTHVHRIVQRLRLVDLTKIGKGKERYFRRGEANVLDFKKGANTDKIEKELMGVIPQRDWFKFTYLIIEHGRAVCRAIGPKCGKCFLSNFCPTSRG